MDCIISAGLALGQKSAAVSVSWYFAVVDYHISRNSTGTEEDCVCGIWALVDCIISIRLGLGQTRTAYYQ